MGGGVEGRGGVEGMVEPPHWFPDFLSLLVELVVYAGIRCTVRTMKSTYSALVKTLVTLAE